MNPSSKTIIITINYDSCQTFFCTSLNGLLEFFYGGENDRLVEYIKDEILMLKYEASYESMFKDLHFSITILRYLDKVHLKWSTNKERPFPQAVKIITVSCKLECNVGGDEEWE